jgi:lipoyl-dependent peroxiredoxin
MNKASKLLYTAKVRTKAGREGGTSRSSDGNLELRMSPPGIVNLIRQH